MLSDETFTLQQQTHAQINKKAQLSELYQSIIYIGSQNVSQSRLQCIRWRACYIAMSTKLSCVRDSCDTWPQDVLVRLVPRTEQVLFKYFCFHAFSLLAHSSSSLSVAPDFSSRFCTPDGMRSIMNLGHWMCLYSRNFAAHSSRASAVTRLICSTVSRMRLSTSRAPSTLKRLHSSRSRARYNRSRTVVHFSLPSAVTHAPGKGHKPPSGTFLQVEIGGKVWRVWASKEVPFAFTSPKGDAHLL